MILIAISLLLVKRYAYVQLSISRLQTCVSMGKYVRSMEHMDVTVSLQQKQHFGFMPILLSQNVGLVCKR